MAENFITGNNPGLGGNTTWAEPAPDQPAIQLLQDEARHTRVLDYLKERLNTSERAMSRFYSRWQRNEKKLQAFINLEELEQSVKEKNDSGEAPKPVSIIIPYAYATQATIVTYLLHTFAGRKPMWQVGSYKEEAVEAARNMENILQYNSDRTRMVKQLFQYFQDSQTYGVGILRTAWKTESALRTVWKEVLGPTGFPTTERFRESRVVYEGNDVTSIDPFNFFPDPHVPMCEVNRKGEYVFWRTFKGKHTLKMMEAAGEILGVDRATPLAADKEGNDGGQSARNILVGGDASPIRSRAENQQNWYQVDQGTCWIIPAELGLGEGTALQLWMFTILNKNRIVQAEPLELDHGMHPVAVIEPYTLGYGFGHMGLTDFLSPIQDIQSWLVNSHMYNVRSTLDNMFVVDPSMVEVEDLKRRGPGKIIRLKRAAYGQDVRGAVQQLTMMDMTSGHIKDLELFMRIGDTLSAVTDNLRGVQTGGGRKSATEVRTSAEAGASRLAAMAKIISSQGLVDLTEQMSLNVQQNMTEDFYMELLGADGQKGHMRITPEHVAGDLHFPIHDGTLPLDRVAMLDVWKEILMGVAQDPELRQQYSFGQIFEYVAELGGAKNIERFRASPEGIPANVQFAPDDLAQGMAGNTPGVIPNPGQRMAGGGL